MRRQTILGVLFLIVGLALIVLAALPAIQRQPVSFAFLALAVAVAVFGAWLLPSSGAPAAVQQIITVVGPYVPRLGGARAGDPPLPPSPTPPKDGA